MPSFATFLLISLPWLNPFSVGPTAAVGPLLFSWVCTAMLLLTWVASDRLAVCPNPVERTRAIMLAWIGAAVLSATIGLLQYLGNSDWLGVWVNHPNTGEAYGNLRQRNQFATLLNIGLAALLCWVSLYARSTAHVALALLVAALMGAGNAASSSRTGLFQLLLLSAMALWWWRAGVADARQRGTALLLGAAAGYLLASFALPTLLGQDPFTSGAWGRLQAGDAECSSRLTLWRNVLYLIAQKPWLGWGWGELDYAHFITLFPDKRFCDILDNAHNLPLHLAVELGLPVALLLCALALGLAWRARPWSERDPVRQLAWAVLAVIVLHSLLEYPLWYGPFQMAAGLSVALLWPKISTKKRAFMQYSQASAAILLIAYCGFAAWQYQLASQIYLAPHERMSSYRENTLEKVRALWMFQDQVQFAELTMSEVSADNAAEVNRLAKKVLHFSPEARVVELLLESARQQGQMEEVRYYILRYQAAFPKEYADWARQAKP